MASLAQSNKYLKDRESLRRMIVENAYDSSVFEGASPAALKDSHSSSKRLKIDSSKKQAKSA